MSNQQPTSRTHPARAALDWAMRSSPWLATSAEAARQHIDWPEHIYCAGAAYAVASAHTVQAEAPPEVRQAIYRAGRERFAIANARLISAAPELLDACKAALSDNQPYIEKCRAAIAKATGEKV